MSTPCPHCQKNLGDLDPIMNQLAQNKLSGKLTFKCKHCKLDINAFSNVGMYYISTPTGNVMIGAA
ncbi:hypothetical protein [Pseudomonas rhodesiae]|uniref:Uncharacterized protein n=1 Tax=Pseudomonas rhodesiae TaxID=76760 RepID=A0AAE8HGY7_9PSED|nr:hypothetical protein [Pseudomonas rhodesiae]TWR49297.1 hypothetical protein FIV35_25605 [Pseudomonas rhodesiae]SDV15440.1 hypothetical protein SAMN04490209_4996 [Pseudomonas rhodesiae]